MEKGFFKKLFDGKKSFASILLNTQNKIFAIYGVDHPTDTKK